MVLLEINSVKIHSCMGRIFIRDLGWVVDPSHKKCIDDKYIRISMALILKMLHNKGVKTNCNERILDTISVENCQ